MNEDKVNYAVFPDRIIGLTDLEFTEFCLVFFEAIGFGELKVLKMVGSGELHVGGAVSVGSVIHQNFELLASRHTGLVPDQLLEHFRSSMKPSTDHGLMVSTGSFSRKTKRYAKARGKIPVDLIDGKRWLERIEDMQLPFTKDTQGSINRELQNPLG